MKASKAGDERSMVVVTEASAEEVAAFVQLCQSAAYDVAVRRDAETADVLFVGAGCAQRASRHAQATAPAFGLLVSHDDTVLACDALLRRCTSILLAPYDATSLHQHLDALGGEEDVDPETYANLVGASPQMRALRRLMMQVARCDAPVLIRGETGTGKELVARGIHYGGARCDQPFVPVNCGALNDELLIAELFGYEKGAFTDAKRAHRGLVAQAAGGTLFLDEIDSLSPRGQAALLRFLQEQEYRPIGSETLRTTDVRVMAASNKDLDALVAQGRFREDLYYRVHLLDIELPPLRAREDDVSVLAEHFLEQLRRRYNTTRKQLHPLTSRWMADYAWPGNVRELQNYVHRIFVMSLGSMICVPQVKGNPAPLASPVVLRKAPDDAPRAYRDEKAKVLAEFERTYLHQVMKVTRGNVSLAARHAGKERRAFRRLLKKHGIERRHYGDSERVDE